MKTELFTFFTMILCSMANAGYYICGPATTGLETSWSVIESRDGTGVWMSHWAVGTGCNGEMADTAVEQMCDDVVIGGEAFCNTDIAALSAKPYEITPESKPGLFCWCRRTQIKQGGQLTEQIGTWVVVEGSDTCMDICAKACANAVSAAEAARIPLASYPK